MISNSYDFVIFSKQNGIIQRILEQLSLLFYPKIRTMIAEISPFIMSLKFHDETNYSEKTDALYPEY